MDHGDHAPTAAIKKGLLISSAQSGRSAVTGEHPEDVREKFANIFEKTAEICRSAGGSLDDIIKMSFYIPGRQYESDLEEAWLIAFPDPSNRPARHVLILSEEETDTTLFHSDFVAYIDSEH